MPVELVEMRRVLALDEHRSFVRAAVALHMSQPALSRCVQSVEERIGTRLFIRSASGVIPTDLGSVFIQHARQLVHLAADLDREVLRNPALRAGHVSVGAGPFPAESILSAALARFIGAHPMVRVRLEVRDWDELARRLRARELDFFVAEVSTLHREHDLEIELLAQHPVFFAARRGHPLAGRGPVSAADTFAFPMVAPARIPPRALAPMLAAQSRASDKAAAARAFPSLECHYLSAVKRIVQRSDAITAVTLSSIAEELRSRQLTLLGSEPWLHLRYGLVAVKGQPLGYAAGRLRELVVQAEAALVLEEKRLLARFKPRARGGRAKTRRPRRSQNVRS